VIYLAANHASVWRLREEGFPLGWIMSPAGLRRPVRGDVAMPWAMDNGLFRPFGSPAAPTYERVTVLGCLAKAMRDGWPTPMFAVVPDVPYRGDVSADVSREWRSVMRIYFPSIPLALAVQDGMSAGALDGYDWCFVAGSTEWKEATMGYWCRESRKRGLRCHIARVNTVSRLRAAIDHGADSADGTCIGRGDHGQIKGLWDELVQMKLGDVA
jgi:hypothetical protein